MGRLEICLLEVPLEMLNEAKVSFDPLVFPLKVGRVLQAKCELRSTTICPSLSLDARGKNDTGCKSEDDGVGRERVTWVGERAAVGCEGLDVFGF
jgi:hypothetical protein